MAKPRLRLISSPVVICNISEDGLDEVEKADQVRLRYTAMEISRHGSV